MALNYLFKRYKDAYILTNLSSSAFTYTLTKQFCGEDTVIFADNSMAGSATESFLITEDGTYVLTLTDNSDTVDIHIMHYDRLLKSIVNGVEKDICNCGCSGCQDCESCDSQLYLINKVLAYYYLTKPQYTAFVEAAASFVNCKVDDAVLCMMTGERFKGESELHGLYSQFILVHYLAFYLYDLQTATDDEEEAYIESKYKSSKILPCVKKNCIDIEALKAILNEMGTFTVISGVYINLPPSAVGNNTINVLNRATTVLTLAMFTTGTTPAYADPENDPVENLRVNSISGSNTGVFKYLGTNITVGQVIPASGITAGNLIHHSPDQNTLQSDSFTFSLSDTGSHSYTPA